METINIELFNKHFPKDFRKEVEAYRLEFLKDIGYVDIKGNTGKWQQSPMTYSDRHIVLLAELTSIQDLYPPNFAIIDYMMKNIDIVKNYSYLDHACGLGLLSVYLTKLGIKCYNYDNWSQFISFEETYKFLSKYYLENSIIDVDHAKSINADMFGSIGLRSVSDNFGQPKIIFSDVRYSTDINRKSLFVLEYRDLIKVNIMEELK